MARLPKPGQDSNTWGDLLNEFLLQVHTSSGALKDNSVTGNTLTPNSVTSASLAPGSVTSAALAADAVQSAALADGSVKLATLSVTNSPATNQVLSYNGTDLAWASAASAPSGITATAVKTSAYTAEANQLIPVDATTGVITITLPAAPADKSKVIIKKIDTASNAVTVLRGGSDVFNKTGGSTSVVLSLQNQAVSLQYESTGGIWYVVSDDLPLSQLDTRFGKYPSLKKKPLPADFPAAAGVMSALLRGQRSTVLHAVGDSTTVGTNAWFAALGLRLGQAFPGYSVWYRSYSSSNDQYNPITQLQAGTANGGGTRGLQLNSGGPFSYQMNSAITGDLDIRVKVALTSWASGSNQVLVAQWNSASTRVFSFQVNGSGSLGLGLSTDGSAALTTVSSTSNPVVSAGGTLWVRATLDADNGSSQRVVTFYTSSDGDTWAQLGNTVTTSGAVTLYNGNPPVTLGLRYTSSSYVDRGVGTYYWVEVRSGINGPSQVPPLIDSWDFILTLDETGYAWVGAPVILLVNGGIGGQKISYFSDPVRKDILHADHGADMFLLSDSHNEGQLSRQTWVTTLSTYVSMVKGYMPARPIVLVGQNPVNPAFFSDNARSKRYARVQSEATWAASQQGVYYVDTYLGFTDLAAQLSASDGLHPTTTSAVTDGTAGYQVWADVLFSQMFAPSIGPYDNPYLA